MLKGMICLWYGLIAAIPTGYQLCNGTNGTPDLRNRFVIGAGGSYDPDDTGGNTQHSHAWTTSFHSHQFVGGTDVLGAANYGTWLLGKGTTGDTDNATSIPPYYGLAYIQRM